MRQELIEKNSHLIYNGPDWNRNEAHMSTQSIASQTFQANRHSLSNPSQSLNPQGQGEHLTCISS